MQQTMEAMRYRDNCSNKTDYTPSGADVDMGDIVDIGNLVGICDTPGGIEDGTLGALETCGVFRCIKDGTSGPVFTKGDPVWFNKSTRLCVNVASNPTTCYLGLADEAAGTNEDNVKVQINVPPVGELADALTTTTTTTTTT